MSPKRTNKAFHDLEKKARKAAAARNDRVAASCYRRLVKHPECKAQTRIESALAFAKHGEVDEVRATLVSLGGISQLTDMQCLQVAHAYFLIGDYQASHGLMMDAWLARGSEIYLVPLAETHERLGDYEEALAMLERLSNPHPRADLIRGLIFTRQDKISEALSLFGKAKEASAAKEPLTAFRAGLEQARCHEKLGDYKKAWQTMTTARARQFPNKPQADYLDRIYAEKRALSLRDCDEFDTIFSEIPTEASSPSPVLLAGHPRSGNSVIAVALSKALNMPQVDESGAWVKALGHSRLDKKSIGNIRSSSAKKLRQDYYRRIGQTNTDLSPQVPHIDKNPGLEFSAARWLLAFPSSKIIFVQRHPLDVIISCLFTYLRPNPYSLQFFTPERALASIQASLSIQDRLVAAAPEHCMTVSYEDFVKTQSLPLDRFEATPASQEIATESILNSPNYFQANKPIHTDSVERFKNYLPYIPDAIANLLL